MDVSQFELQLRTLCAGFNVPPTPERLEAYEKAFGKLNAAMWARMVEHCLAEAGPNRMPTVRELWDIRRELRVGPPQYIHERKETDGWQGDAWDLAANRHLYAYLLATVLPAGAAAPMARNPMAFVRYKHAWARDMREAADAQGHVPVDVQQVAWRDCMQRAMQEAALS